MAVQSELGQGRHPDAVNADRWYLFRHAARAELGIAALTLLFSQHMPIPNEVRWIVAGVEVALGTVSAVGIHKPDAFKRNPSEQIA